MLNDDFTNSAPISNISAATANPDRYLPGMTIRMFLSAGRCANRKPIKVTIDDAASDKLFIASAMIATEPVI